MAEKLNPKRSEGEQAYCIRCKLACAVVEDCYVHEFGKTPFLESDCCGAPVVWRPVRKND